ncbi:MAG: hypothetical protein R3B72_51275 [Polyangiaceae bacterium]
MTHTVLHQCLPTWLADPSCRYLVISHVRTSGDDVVPAPVHTLTLTDDAERPSADDVIERFARAAAAHLDALGEGQARYMVLGQRDDRSLLGHTYLTLEQDTAELVPIGTTTLVPSTSHDFEPPTRFEHLPAFESTFRTMTHQNASLHRQLAAQSATYHAGLERENARLLARIEYYERNHDRLLREREKHIDRSHKRALEADLAKNEQAHKHARFDKVTSIGESVFGLATLRRTTQNELLAFARDLDPATRAAIAAVLPEHLRKRAEGAFAALDDIQRTATTHAGSFFDLVGGTHRPAASSPVAPPAAAAPAPASSPTSPRPTTGAATPAESDGPPVCGLRGFLRALRPDQLAAVAALLTPEQQALLARRQAWLQAAPSAADILIAFEVMATLTRTQADALLEQIDPSQADWFARAVDEHLLVIEAFGQYAAQHARLGTENATTPERRS